MFSRGSTVSPFHGCWRSSPSPVLRKTRVSPEDPLRWGRRRPVSACVGSGAGLGGKPVFASPVGQRIMAKQELPAHRWGGRIVRKFGMVSFTRLCLKWVTNKDLLYSTGNSAQSYVAAWMGAEFGVRACVWLSPFAVHQRLFQHC